MCSEVSALRSQIQELRSHIAPHNSVENDRCGESGGVAPAESLGDVDDSAPFPQQGCQQPPSVVTEAESQRESRAGSPRNEDPITVEFHGPLSQLHFAIHLKNTVHKNAYILAHVVGCSLEFASLNRTCTRPLSISSIEAEGAVQEPAPPFTETLSRSQQEYYIRQFWQVQQCFILIVDEDSFRSHFESLWLPNNDASRTRSTSHLVDMVLAVGLQFDGNSDHCPPGIRQTDCSKSSCVALAAWHYQRANVSFLNGICDPTLKFIQLTIIAVLYLENASLTSHAYNILGLIVRTAHTLGLHLEPSPTLSQTEQKFRKSLWWSLYMLDSQFSIALGRPWAINVNYQLTFNENDLLFARSSSDHELTLSSFHVYRTKLFAAARTVQATIDRVRTAGKTSSLPVSTLEDSAHPEIREQMNQSVELLHLWRTELPEFLKTARRGDGESFSTDQSRIAVDCYAPLWLQRQRVLLELFYLNLMMVIYRSFIIAENANGPPDKEVCKTCRSHATAIIVMLNQLYTETDLVNGFAETYRILWNATLSVIGFSLLMPEISDTDDMRKVLHLSEKIFEIIPHRASGHATDLLRAFLYPMTTDSRTNHTIAPELMTSKDGELGIPPNMDWSQQWPSEFSMAAFDETFDMDDMFKQDVLSMI